MLNNMKVFILMAGLTALFIVVGGALGGEQGMLFAFLLAAGLNFFAYFNSGTAALRAYQARIVSRDEAPELYDIVEGLSRKAGLPMPKVAIAPHEQPNAFASGRNPEHAVVCVTERHHAARGPARARGRARARAWAHQERRHPAADDNRDARRSGRHDVAHRHGERRWAWGARQSAHGDPRAACGDADPVRDQPPARVRRRPGRRDADRPTARPRERAAEARLGRAPRADADHAVVRADGASRSAAGLRPRRAQPVLHASPDRRARRPARSHGARQPRGCGGSVVRVTTLKERSLWQPRQAFPRTSGRRFCRAWCSQALPSRRPSPAGYGEP